MYEPKVPGGPNWYYQPPVPEYVEEPQRAFDQLPDDITFPTPQIPDLPDIVVPDLPAEDIRVPDFGPLVTPAVPVQFTIPKIDFPVLPFMDPGWLDFLMKNAGRVPKVQAGQPPEQLTATLAVLEDLRAEYEATKEKTDADVAGREGPEEGDQAGPAGQGRQGEGAGPAGPHPG